MIFFDSKKSDATDYLHYRRWIAFNRAWQHWHPKPHDWLDEEDEAGAVKTEKRDNKTALS